MRLMIFVLMFKLAAHSVYGFDELVGAPPNDDVIRRIAAFLPNNPVVVEGGTYDGTDTMELAALLPNAKIYTFEPVPELFSRSVERFKQFNYKINSYNYALSDRIGSSTMYLSEEESNPDIVSMSSSLLVPKEHLVYSPTTLFKKNILVRTTTIDNWARENNIPVIDFLKLDIQGNELNVLKASLNILSTVKAVLMEVEFIEAYEGQFLFGDIKDWMEQQGFKLDCLYLNGCGWFGDALFIRKK